MFVGARLIGEGPVIDLSMESPVGWAQAKKEKGWSEYNVSYY